MRVVNVKLLPDGSGRVRIHWFVHSESGPAKTPGGVVKTSQGPARYDGARGYIACQPQRTSVLPQMKGNEYTLLVHSDDVRAATCPDCLATVEAQAMLQELGETLDSGVTQVPVNA